MIHIENLDKQFGNHSILKNITLTIDKGEVVAIIGPSGGGKSTLLRMLNRLETPTAGTIAIEGVTLTKETELGLRKRMGMVFQLFHLFPHMIVLENITYALTTVHQWDKAKSNERAEFLLSQVGLQDKAMMYPNRLSGGQKQRVAIARALAANPDVMLFDEPTSALDPENVKEVVQVIRQVANEGRTCVIVTHEIALAKDVAKRIIFLDQGEVIEDAPTEQFFTAPRSERARQFLEQLL